VREQPLTARSGWVGTATLIGKGGEGPVRGKPVNELESTKIWQTFSGTHSVSNIDGQLEIAGKKKRGEKRGLG